MADQDSSPKFPAPTPDHSGLECVPLPGLESTHQPWIHQSQKEFYNQVVWTEASRNVGPMNEPKQRILGLSVRRFWIVVIALVVIIAGAIGGGVGGGLAARGQAGSSSSAASNQAASDQDTNTPPTPSNPAANTSGIPASSSSSTTKTDTPSATTSGAAGGVSPAPTDQGCPIINGTTYTPTDGSGKAIPLKAGGAVQSFLRYCDTNWPAGAQYSNPRLHDIMKIYMPSLEECITACAAYNANYEANLANGMGSAEGGLCRAVSIVKTPGEYCYLKNNTGKVDTFGQPKLYASAVLYMASSSGGV